MQNKTLLMVGLGDLGGRIASQAIDASFDVWGLRRGSNVPQGVQLIQHDASQTWPVLPTSPSDIVLCLSPTGREASAYRKAYFDVAHQALRALHQHPEAHVWLISSTGVYGQSKGEWVDEQSPRCPKRETAKVLVDAENVWLESEQPVTILRPSGLYGPGRFFLIRQAQQGILPPKEPAIFTNRIHIEDAARAVMHLIVRRHQGLSIAREYNLTDTEPAPLDEILAWLQGQLGISSTQVTPIYRDSKRVRHTRLKETGFVWRYPDYRAGYEEILNAYTQG